MLREAVAGRHVDGAVAPLEAAVVKFDALAAGGVFELAGHRVGDPADVGQHVPAAPAGQFRRRFDVLFRQFRGDSGHDAGGAVEFCPKVLWCD